MICREGEPEKHWYRSDRYFVVNNQWFFTTREHLDVGPFGSQDNARKGLQLFIKNVEQDGTDINIAASIAVNGEWSQTLYH